MIELDRLRRIDLLALARRAGIPGRSRMSAAELAEAIRVHLLAEPVPVDPVKRPHPGRWDGVVDRHHQCGARLVNGIGCDLPARPDNEHCGLHGGVVGTNPGGITEYAHPILGELGPSTWPRLRRHQRLASYDPDPFGLDPVATEIAWWLASHLYRDWFDVQVEGIETVPMDGAAMLVPNHGGGALPYDAMMLQLAVLETAPQPRRVRVIGTEIFNMLPWLSHLYRRTGGAYASRSDADLLLARGHLIGVFPEGAAGFQKPRSEAYKVGRFARGGFATAAAKHGAPIVPVAIMGSEDTHPIVHSSATLAHVVRMVFPEQRVDEIGIFLNPIPLPVRWTIRFLPPIQVPTRADRLDALEASETTRAAIQAALDDLR